MYILPYDTSRPNGDVDSVNGDRVLGLFLTAISSFISVQITLFSRRRRRILMQERKKGGNINIGAIFGMDIGGTLTKIVYFEANMDRPAKSSMYANNLPTIDEESLSRESSSASDKPTLVRNRSFVDLEEPKQKAALQEFYEYVDKGKELAVRDDKQAFYSNILGGCIHFLHFETRNMMEAINYLSSTAITENIRTIGCTGGGGHKYAQQFADQLQIRVVPLDELGCLVRGMDFTLTNVDNECYTYRRSSSQNIQKSFDDTPKDDLESKQWQADVRDEMKVVIPKDLFISNDIFPYLVVNIGSGVSILKVSSPGKFERVSGSSLGGGTYWGLCRLLTSCSSYEKVLDLAETGNAAEVDMLVKDIYGGSYDQMNLNGSMVASSFGKLVMKENPREGVKEEDLAIALLMMITNNIGQVAYLNAQLHECRKIFFVGSFLRHNSISCRRLAFAINFWSKGANEALFLKHEGYFGALGTFLQSAFESDVDQILRSGHTPQESSGEMSSVKKDSELVYDDSSGIVSDLSTNSTISRSSRMKSKNSTSKPRRFRSLSSDNSSGGDLDGRSRLSPVVNAAAMEASKSSESLDDLSSTYSSSWKDFHAHSLEWNNTQPVSRRKL